MLLNCPSIKVLVKKSYLSNESKGFENGYLIAITANSNQSLSFTVHLESGALFSGLPIEAIYCEKFGITKTYKFNTSELQPWTCLEGPAQLLIYDHLENYDVKCKINSKTYSGNYLMTIAYHGRGLSRDPEQSKTHNIVVLENGQLAALPNNYMLFQDQYFTENKIEFPKHYRRQSKYYFSN